MNEINDVGQIVFDENTPREIVTAIDPTKSVMEIARQAGVSAVIGRCGGFGTCGTCHLYADVSNETALPMTPQLEHEVLEGMEQEVKPESRLSCQICISSTGRTHRFMSPK